MAEKKKTGLDLLREPFPAHQISKLPKPTKAQTDEVRADFKKGIRCQICGQWHHPKVVHLDYVGHAALTDRLLECDPHWNWEPVAFNERGLPTMDESGGMWIRLTVCDQTRLGYGHADGKKGGDAIKEVIGDALRNAAMRFGAALDLWHKGELHVTDDPQDDADHDNIDHDKRDPAKPDPAKEAIAYLNDAESLPDLRDRWEKLPRETQHIPAVIKAKDERKAALGKAVAPPPTTADDMAGDEIPY